MASRKQATQKISRAAAGKRVASKKTKSQTAANGTNDVCFVIMPFGGWLDSYYSSIYCPAIQRAGLDPHRADDLFRPSTIVNDIWSYTKKSKVMLADLTGKNPNVFYELGLAHALAKPVILIAESMEDIPFDLRALRIILYDKNAPDWGDRLGEKIENSIKEVLQSPIEAVLPAFLDVKASSKPSISSEQKDFIELKQEMDLLRRALVNREQTYQDTDVRRSGPDYARELIERYLRMGMPVSEIVRRTSRDASAPTNWVARQVDNAISRRNESSSVASSSSGIAEPPPPSSPATPDPNDISLVRRPATQIVRHTRREVEEVNARRPVSSNTTTVALKSAKQSPRK